jgi:hypothetical protein
MTVDASLTDVARAIAGTDVSQTLYQTLRTVRGVAPIVQTIHILSVTALMASVVFVNLRVLGLAVPGQQLPEMLRRLMPWTWTALVLLLLSGSVFVLALPNRYLHNPVLGIKLSMLIPAVVLAVVFARRGRGEDNYWEASQSRRRSAKAMAAVSLLLWVMVVLAGRWIAYTEYLFP